MQMLRSFSSFSYRRTTLFSLALSVVILASVWSFVTADLVAPRPDDRRITQVVTLLVGREHLTKHPLDNEITQRGLKSFLDSLDPLWVEGEFACICI